MIWTLKVALCTGAYASAEWVRVFEIDESATLEDLHFAIQDAVNFDDDHLYAFYIARTERSRDRVLIDDEEEEDGGGYSIPLTDLFPLPKGRKLFYRFDFGDNWRFSIVRIRKAPHEPVSRVRYPRVVEKIGKNPKQYG